MDELETYQEKNNRESVLLFPCLPSRLRFLIHKIAEDLPELRTFSVGYSWSRRVVVCHSALREETKEDDDLESHDSLCVETLRSGQEMESSLKPKSSTPSQTRGPKRPDKPLYMPRGARERLTQQNLQEPPVCEALQCSASNESTSLSDSCSCHETAEAIMSRGQESLPSVENPTENSSACCPEEGKQKLTATQKDDEQLLWRQAISRLGDISLEDNVTNEDDCVSVSDNTQDEDGSTDTDDVTAEIKALLKEAVSFSIEHVHNDYSPYENLSVNPDDFRHVIEIYDFPAVFKTDDLLDAFNDFSNGGMKIKWVDNTHALGVFSSESAALNALSICHPLLKTRALAEGSRKAKGKAVRRAEFIQPVKERPRTDSAVARRMVTRALGLQGRGRALRY